MDQILQYGQSMAVVRHGMTMTGYVPSVQRAKKGPN